MSIDGHYRADYSGSAGKGFGHVSVRDGQINGLDVGGGVYTGTVQSSNGQHTVKLKADFQPGMLPVSGGVNLGPVSLTGTLNLDDEHLLNGKPFNIGVDGPVDVTLTPLVRY